MAQKPTPREALEKKLIEGVTKIHRAKQDQAPPQPKPEPKPNV